MKQTLKIQALIYSAAYLLSSFIAWDLTWLPCRVYIIAVNMPNYTGYQRAGIFAYVSVSALAATFMLLHFKHKKSDGYTDGYMAAAVVFYIVFAVATLAILTG